MNILFVSPFDLVANRLWGPTTRIFEIAKDMKARGHNIYFSGGEPFKGEKPDNVEGVPFIYLPTFPMHRYPYDANTSRELDAKRRGCANLCMMKTAFRRGMALKKICGEKKIDVIYLGRTFPESALACWLARYLTDIPVIVDWDDIEGLFGFASSSRQLLRTQLIYTFSETYFAARADAVVVASRFIHDFARDIGVPEERLFYAPTVGDHKKFSTDGNSLPFVKNGKAPLLFYAGNLRSENGVKTENIIYALRGVKKEFPDARLLVVGGGDLLDNNGKPGLLPHLARELGLEDSIDFTGDVPYSTMPDRIKNADICLALFPVNVITMAKSPIKVYEYLCSGKPVVARNVGEISHCIKDGENGYLVHTDNPEEYSEKIIKALSDREKLKEVSDRARRTIEENFNWQRSTDIALEACERAMALRKNRR